MSEELKLRMAKADQGDIDRLCQFFNFIEEYFDSGTMTNKAGQSAFITEEKFTEVLRRRWSCIIGPDVSSSWSRVVWGCDTLIKNCCDPNLDYLDFKPELKELNARAEAAEAKYKRLVERLRTLCPYDRLAREQIEAAINESEAKG